MILFNKHIGETPKQALDRLRIEHPEHKDSILSYAGRLDPMAEGQLLVLVGEENKNREKFLGLDKEYEVEFLFGIETDTYDALGKITDVKLFDSPISEQIIVDCKKLFESSVGKQIQKFPPYSSKTLDGVALHEISRNGNVDEIELPEHEIEIKKIEIISEPHFVNFGNKTKEAIERIQKVSGDFRQEEIIKLWQLEEQKNVGNLHQLLSVSVRIQCSSGTYMRTLAHDLGRKMGSGAIAFHIKRTMIYF